MNPKQPSLGPSSAIFPRFDQILGQEKKFWFAKRIKSPKKKEKEKKKKKGNAGESRRGGPG